MNRTLRTLLSLGLAAGLLVLLFRWGGLDADELADTLRRLSPEVYARALALHAGIYLMRAERFRRLIPPATRPSFSRVLAVSSAHNMASYVLPAKTGEATFVVYMKSTCGVPASEGLASLLVSRLLDLTVLVGTIGLASLALAAGGQVSGGAEWLAPLGGALLLASALTGLLCVRTRWIVGGFVLAVRAVRADRTALGRRALAKADVLADALTRAGAEGRLLAGALISIPLWLGVILFFAVLARALGLGEAAGIVHAAFGSGLSTVSNLLPINGFAGFGTQEAGWAFGFGALGVPRDLALSTGVAVHLVHLFNVLLFGLLGHLAMGFAMPSPRRSEGRSE